MSHSTMRFHRTSPTGTRQQAGALGAEKLGVMGGFVAGLVLALPVWLRRGAQAFWQRTEGHPPHPETQFEAARSNIPLVRRKR